MLIVSNWKAYVETTERAKELFALAKRLSSGTTLKLVLAPSAPHLGVLAPHNKSKVAFSSQDVSGMVAGAHTGELSAALLSELGVSYAIVGHSERRAMGETDMQIAEKLRHTVAHGLTPILCVGEKERDHDGKYLQLVRSQLTNAFALLSPKERASVVIAYEPIWAIGKTSREAITSVDLAETVLYIRKVLAELGKSSGKSKVLYGGSVEPENIRELAAGSGVDGFLVGHASVDPEHFRGLVKALA